MSVSKGNELVQELYNRLTGLWYHKGQYNDERFTQKDVKRLIDEIKKEYEDEQIQEPQGNNK